MAARRRAARALGIVNRQRPEQETVDDGEDRRVGADTERERRDDHDGERALPGEEPERVTDVAADVVEERAVTSGADPFLHLLDAADLDQREAPRLGGGNPSAILSAVDISTNERASSSRSASARSRRRIHDSTDATRLGVSCALQHAARWQTTCDPNGACAARAACGRTPSPPFRLPKEEAPPIMATVI